MNKGKKLFHTELIKESYLPWYEYWYNWVVVVLLYVPCIVLIGNDSIIKDELLWLILIVYIIAYMYFRRRKRSGILEIYENAIAINSDSTKKEFTMHEISDLEIIRGSTHHIVDFGDTPRLDGNTISFIHSGTSYGENFLIETDVRNVEFEFMIEELSKSGLSFRYKSV